MALAETLILQALPLTMARTFCRFGLNVRLLMLVIFLPTPPRYFAFPRRVIERPNRVFLPVNGHARDIVNTPVSIPSGTYLSLSSSFFLAAAVTICAWMLLGTGS